MSGFRETNRRYIKTNNRGSYTKRAFDSTLLKYDCKRFEGKLRESRFTRSEPARALTPATEQGARHTYFNRVKTIKTIESSIRSSNHYANTTEYENDNTSPQHYAEDFVVSGTKSTGRIAVTSARRAGSRLVPDVITSKIVENRRTNAVDRFAPVYSAPTYRLRRRSKTVEKGRTNAVDKFDPVRSAPTYRIRKRSKKVENRRMNAVDRFVPVHSAPTFRLRKRSKKVENRRTNAVDRFTLAHSAATYRIRKRSKIVEKGRMNAVDRFAPVYSAPTYTIHKSFRKQSAAFVNRYKISRILTFRKPAGLGIRRKLKDLAKRKQTTGLLMKALAGGGGLVVAVVLICVLLGGAFFLYGDTGTTSYQDVNEKVQGYQALIEENCEKYELPEFVDLVKAVMMQESGGEGTDPMQASECGYNEKYPKEPGGIKDHAYSVACGVQYLKSCLDAAEVNGPLDMDHIKLALQGYNYGKGYITWAVDTYGGYSKANAVEYGELMANKNGWKSYGDKDYVEHVLRYYPYGNYSYDIENTGPGRLGLPIKGMGLGNITSHFGPRISPGGIGSTEHDGIDIGFPEGTHVLACESGEVTFAGWNGGYGKCIKISHIGDLNGDGATVETIYAHLSEIKVRVGQKVVRGQYIGEVGNTGNSTGPHLHLGVLVDGEFVNPERGWVRME